MSNIEVFMGLWKSPKFDLGFLSFFFLFPDISVPSIFKHFLVELGCWDFGYGFVPLFMKSIPPATPWRGLKPPKKSDQFPRFLKTFQLSYNAAIFSVGWDHHFVWGFFEFLKSGPSAPLGAPRKNLAPPKVKFFIYCPILIKFKTKHFHMFTNDNWDINLWIGAPLPHGPLPPPFFQKSKILHLLCDFYEIWNTTFSYVYIW